MGIWSLNQDLIGPEKKMDQIIMQNRFRFDQLKLAFGRENYIINEKSSEVYESKIVQQNRFEQFILMHHMNGNESESNDKRKNLRFKVPVYNPQQITQELARIRTNVSKIPSQLTFYMIRESSKVRWLLEPAQL